MSNNELKNDGFGGNLPSGASVSFWMDADPTHTPLQTAPYFNRSQKDCISALQCNIWHGYAANSTQQMMDELFRYDKQNNGAIDGTPVSSKAIWNGACKRSRIYMGIRLVLKFNNQNGPNPHEEATSPVSIARGFGNMVKKSAKAPTVMPPSRVKASGDATVSVMLTPSLGL